ncbi:hypothetical protein [Kiloniella majae]|nr:hypothetical protein [Kiloniella majae]
MAFICTSSLLADDLESTENLVWEGTYNAIFSPDFLPSFNKTIG